MKNFKFYFLGLIALNLFVTSCNDDDDNDMDILNIVETADTTQDLSILVEALQAANLDDDLAADGPFTVFAPTNAAFTALLDSNSSWNTLDDIPADFLENVLLFHVIAGSQINSGDLTTGYQSTLAQGPGNEAISLRINTDGGISFNGDAGVETADVETSNGVIHIIDKVMLPPNVVDLASNDNTFSSLVSALTREDLTTDFVSVLSGDGPFTVFAPTNAAFTALLDSNSSWNTLNDIPVATLEAVLNYHVVSASNVQADQLTDGQTVATLGGDLTVDLSDGAKLGTTSGQTVNIVATDVQGTNGVVHAVDTVLLP